MNLQRRQTGEVGVEGGRQAGRGIAPTQVRPGHHAQCVPGHDGVVGAVRAGATHRQVRPGREADGGGGQLDALVTERDQRRQHQAAAGGVADEGNGVRRVPLVQKGPVRGDRVIDRSRETMLGRPPVVHPDTTRPGGAGHGRHYREVRGRCHPQVPAAVEIDDRADRWAILGGDRQERHPVGLGRREDEPVERCQRRGSLRLAHGLEALRRRELLGRAQTAGDDACHHLLMFDAGHVGATAQDAKENCWPTNSSLSAQSRAAASGSTAHAA